MQDLHTQQHDQNVIKRQGGHTPGPWVEDGLYICFGEAASGVTLAKVFEATDDGVGDHANARLMAAAPDLLEALQGAIQVWEGDGTTNIGDWLANAHTAIAKATGK